MVLIGEMRTSKWKICEIYRVWIRGASRPPAGRVRLLLRRLPAYVCLSSRWEVRTSLGEYLLLKRTSSSEQAGSIGLELDSEDKIRPNSELGQT